MRGMVLDLTLWTYSANFWKVMLFFFTFYVLSIFFWAAVSPPSLFMLIIFALK